MITFPTIEQCSGECMKVFVSKSLINCSSELESKTDARLSPGWEIKGARASLSGRGFAVSEGRDSACCWNEYSKWGIDWPLWGTSTLNLLVKCVRKYICIYITKAPRHKKLGQNSNQCRYKIELHRNWIHQLFLNRSKIELCGQKFIKNLF